MLFTQRVFTWHPPGPGVSWVPEVVDRVCLGESLPEGALLSDAVIVAGKGAKGRGGCGRRLWGEDLGWGGSPRRWRLSLGRKR